VILCCLMVLSTSCSRVVTKTEVFTLMPPEHLLNSRKIPDFSGKSNIDLLNYTVEIKAGFEACEVDKETLRKWRGDSVE